MSEATEVPMVCVDCGGTLTDDDAYWLRGCGAVVHITFSQCFTSLNERLTASTQRAEAAEAEATKWRGSYIMVADAICGSSAGPKDLAGQARYLRAERDALRKEVARLDFLADEPVFEGFADSPLDVYELESIVAEQNGRSEPTQADRREAFRRMIDAALAVQP